MSNKYLFYVLDDPDITSKQLEQPADECRNIDYWKTIEDKKIIEED